MPTIRGRELVLIFKVRTFGRGLHGPEARTGRWNENEFSNGPGQQKKTELATRAESSQ